MRRVVWLAVMWSLVACGGKQPAEGEPAAEAAGAEALEPAEVEPPKESAIALLGLEGPDKPWAEMSHEEREWYMIAKVQPIMHEVFRNYDADRYAQFECAPCHGEDGKEKNWKMPSDHLSAIPPFDSEEFKEMRSSRLGTFMAEEVTPTMAKIMGMPAYDPATGQGFSCYGCHPKE